MVRFSFSGEMEAWWDGLERMGCDFTLDLEGGWRWMDVVGGLCVWLWGLGGLAWITLIY